MLGPRFADNLMQSRKRHDLPLHAPNPSNNSRFGSNTAQNNGSTYGVQLNNALERGLDMAGVKRTKAGSDDKEQAYVVKSYTMLGFLLLTALILFTLFVFAATVYMDIAFVKRDRLHEMAKNRASNHKAQVKLMSAHLKLQQALDAEIHETLRIEEFRAVLERGFGDMENQIMTRLPTEDEQLIKDIREFIDTLGDKKNRALDSLVNQFIHRSTQAKMQLQHIAKEIIQDIDLDGRQKQMFEKELRDMGRLQKGQKLEDLDYGKILSEGEGKELGLDVKDESENENNGFGNADGIDFDDLSKDLDSFFKKINDLDFPLINSEVVDEWEKQLNLVIETMDDSEKEADIQHFVKYVNDELLKHGMGKLETFNEEKSVSVLDYFENMIYQAKLAPHKQTILDLFAGWREKKLTPFQVLGNIESIAESQNLYLIYEWLNDFQ